MSDKNAKKDSEKTASEKTAMEAKIEELKCKFVANWRVVLAVFIVLIIFFSAHMAIIESKISAIVTSEIATLKPDLAALKSDLTALKSELDKFDVRLIEVEKGSIDVEAVKEDIVAIKKASEDFVKRLAVIINAEEDKLTRLEKDLENQKVYIDGLKVLREGGVK